MIPLAVEIAIWITLLAFSGCMYFWAYDARRRYENVRNRFENDVETMSVEIQARLKKVAEAEKQQLLNNERHRIMRDVHDGVGGLLVRALALTDPIDENKQVREILTMALTDLRLIVSSLNPEDSRLSSLVANFRHLHERMHGQGNCRHYWGDGCIGRQSRRANALTDDTSHRAGSLDQRRQAFTSNRGTNPYRL